MTDTQSMISKTRAKFLLSFCGLVIVATASNNTHAQVDSATCGELFRTGQYGPYDYRSELANPANKSGRPSPLGLVEGAHFTAPVEALIRGSKNTLAGGDIDYTLRAFPNHPRALVAMMRYAEKMQSPKPPGADYSVECYFDRAIRFSADDPVVRMIYATFLHKANRLSEAVQQLERATFNAGDNPFTHYNIGLVYYDLKEYDRALQQAHRALALGFTRTELRDQLQSVGKWMPPVQAGTTEQGAASSGPPSEKR